MEIDLFAKLPDTPSELNAVVLAAVLRERERCAKVAEGRESDLNSDYNRACWDIAERIREGI